MVGRKHRFLCFVLSIAILLSPSIQVLACTPDCTDEQDAVDELVLLLQEYGNLKAECEEVVRQAQEAVEALEDLLEQANEDLLQAEDDFEEAEEDYEKALKAYNEAKANFWLAVIIAGAGTFMGPGGMFVSGTGLIHLEAILELRREELVQAAQDLNEAHAILTAARTAQQTASTLLELAKIQLLLAKANSLQADILWININNSLLSAIQARDDCLQGN